jgi:sporulation integral membrane protein YtvI
MYRIREEERGRFVNPAIAKIFRAGGVLLGGYLALRYVLPLLTPFLLGLILALAAEPAVGVLERYLRLRRGLASGIGVGLALLLVMLAALALCGLVIRELRALAGVLPELESSVRSGMGALSSWLLGLAERAPEGIRSLLKQTVAEFFSGGAALLQRLGAGVLRLASGILSRVPGGALSFFTAVISAFMISAKLPRLKDWLNSRIPGEKREKARAALGGVKTAVLGWLMAQLRLSGVTLLVTGLGLLLLRIPHAALWAVLIAVVDALPVLGAGAVLVPWSLASFLQGDLFRAFALLGIYGGAAVTRSVLEPRLVGRHLGLDPLVTLMALYAGYRLLGIGGMLLSPVLTVAAVQLLRPGGVQ